jgi:hypothetical protein
LTEALEITTSFLKMIDIDKEHLRSEKILTMNALFEEACRLDKIMMRDTSLNRDKNEQHRKTVDLLYQKM